MSAKRKENCSTLHLKLTAIALLFSLCVQAQQQSAAELAKKLANPIASLISVPFQNNTDYGIGQYNGSRNTMNIQPVVPISLSPKLNLITRYIVPIITQNDVTASETKQSGFSDAVVSGFFSPAESKNGFTWGAGPVFLLPVATNDYLGTNKFGIGPTAVALKQANGWTVGGLINQLWSVSGSSDRPDVNQMYLQPFIAYSFKSGAGLGSNSELTFNWKGNSTTGTLNLFVSAITKLGNQTIQVLVGPRVPLAAPQGGKPDWGWRAQLVFLFPR
jgi:hypothetical protein